MRAALPMLFALVLLWPSSSGAIPRDEVMARAKAFSYHPWRCTASNLTASCTSSYKSSHIVNEDYLGLPYDWGGYVSIFDFDQRIAQGYGAGSEPYGAILSCTTGLDCSGFVSQCWDTGHYTTSNLADISTEISPNGMLPGDVFNDAGNHVVLFSHNLANGEPLYYEAGGYNTHINVYGGWSAVAGFVPRRYSKIEGSSASDPLGTTTNPIEIKSWPYSDSRDTRQAVSDVLDGCGVAPLKGEKGHEFIYEIVVTSPGTITASVSDDANTDVDVHLFGSLNTNDCLARHDATISHPVDCGTYYVVVDTYANSGSGSPGPYTLTVDITPSGSSCGSGAPTYAPQGEVGDACAHPDNTNLPYCNPNLGGIICIHSNTESFCSLPCKTDGECAAVFTGGCCRDLSGKNEFYCLSAPYCGGFVRPDSGTVTTADAGVSDAAKTGDGPSPLQDGGAPRRDGALPADGVKPDDPAGGGGCNVGAGDAGPSPLATLLFGLFGALLLRRRRG